MLRSLKCRRFTRGSSNDKSRRTLLNMKVDQALETCVIDPIIAVKRRYERYQAALKHD